MRAKSRKRGPQESAESLKVKRKRDDIVSLTSNQISDYINLDDLVKHKSDRVVLNVKKKKAKIKPRHCEFCDNKFPSIEALERHLSLKAHNTGRQYILPRSFKADGSHIIVCAVDRCCYSTKTLADIYTHDKFHHKSENFTGSLHKYSGQFQGGLISVVTIIENMPEPSENLCGKCLQNFVSVKTLANHKPNCVGKQLFSCPICKAGFMTHETMITHVKSNHKEDTAFKLTGSFVGKPRKQSSKLKNSNTVDKSVVKNFGNIFERTHVPYKSGLTHSRQVLTPKLKSDLCAFIKRQILVNQVIKMHFVLECVIAKPDGHSEKRIRWQTRSVNEKITRQSVLLKSIERHRVNIQRNLDMLQNMPSGFKCESIKSITLVYGALPPVRGGCEKARLSKQVNSFKSVTRRGLLDILGEKNACFRDAVLCSLFSKQLFNTIVAAEEVKCDNHRIFCECRNKAEKIFKKAQRQGKI